MDTNSEVIKKKRGRKKKEVLITDSQNNELQSPNIQITLEEIEEPIQESPPVAKKRGRKPKGGKLVTKQSEPRTANNIISNVILHLKCSMSELQEYNEKMNKMVTDPLNYNPSVPPDIMTYNDDSFFKYETNESTVPTDEMQIQNTSTNNYAYVDTPINNTPKQLLCVNCQNINNSDEMDEDIVSVKDINQKLKRLKINLYKNMMNDKKSACFWCTYEFDNLPCYIPKYEMDDQIYGYGSFCRPECAVAYLMKENIDDSTKFERYHLLNQIYSKIYDFKKNIKPAPNPYFLLDKFYGNLTIQEYRKLLKTEHMLLVIEKPLTRILPELHEDTEDTILNIYGGGSKNITQTNNGGVYKVKRQSEKQQGPSKTSIIRDKFGLV